MSADAVSKLAFRIIRAALLCSFNIRSKLFFMSHSMYRSRNQLTEESNPSNILFELQLRCNSRAVSEARF